jgi:hypothetical protein
MIKKLNLYYWLKNPLIFIFFLIFLEVFFIINSNKLKSKNYEVILRDTKRNKFIGN